MNFFYRLTTDKELRKHLPFFVNSYCSDFDQPFTSHWKGAAAHHFILTLKGAGYAEIDGKKFELKEGEIFFYKLGLPVKYYKKDNEFNTCFVSFDGFACNSLFEYYKIPDYTVFKSSSFATALTNFCHYAEKGVSEVKVAGKLYPLIIDFCLLINKNDIPRSFEIAVSYIKGNFNRDIPISELAKLSGVSQSVLFKQFKEILGTTPVAYITSIRIDYAKTVLETLPHLPLETIAVSSGFSSASYFIETFKKHEGITPTKYKKENSKH